MPHVDMTELTRERFASGIRPSSFGIDTLLTLPLFILLCTMNSAGYRYGASDQAFYQPVVLRALDAHLFPRDAALLDAQGRLTFYDEAVAALAHVVPVDLPYLFVALYLVTLALLFVAARSLGARWYRARWATSALVAAFTLKHAVAKTGANTLEGYFHPRQLAFAIALLAVVAFLDRRDGRAGVLLLVAGALHPTATAWVAVWLLAALWVARPAWRTPLAAVAICAVLTAAWAVFRGPLAGRGTTMDAAWLAVIADKDYLFPLAWPIDAWVTNLVALPIILLGWHVRRRAGTLVARETALVIGAFALVALFACWLPFNAARVALAVQLQTSRLFWILDVFATMYLVALLANGTARRAMSVAIVVALLSLARGMYIMFVQFRDRPVFAVTLPNGDWREAMLWARQTPIATGWLADPLHAARYGSSVRVAAERDVFLEQMKDTALAMYDRGVAMRVADRERALAVDRWDTAAGARALGARYHLDYLVIDRPLDLPLAHQAGSLFIYRLR